MRRALLLMAAVAAGLLGPVQDLCAHEMTMAELELRELSAGRFVWLWGQSGSDRPIDADLSLRWPEGCSADAQSLQCAQGLRGKLAVEGVGKRYSAVLAHITWLDGQASSYTLTSAQPEVFLLGGARDARSAWELARAYVVLGVEHILSGVDHLLFVIGLLFLVGFERRLALTITAFTLAHSLTLAASVLGWLSLRAAPVEVCIALSIVLVAREAMHAERTLTRRFPALVAFLFGLVHGLGFAGALRDVGLPRERLLLPLLGFNIGVELGQLATVALAWLCARALARWRLHAALRVPALYGIGCVAAYWVWLRVLALGA